MPVTDTPVALFLKGLSSDPVTGGLAGAASRFADTFLVAGEFGTRAVNARDFALALPKRKQLMDSLGWKSTKLVRLKESMLGNRHLLAEAVWRFVFARNGGEEKSFEVDSSYLLDLDSEGLKIVVYLTYQDVTVLARAEMAPPAP